MSRFLVVNFIDEDTVEVVPENWENSGFCYWPSTSAIRKIKKLVLSSAHPDTNTWSKVRTRILYSTDSYDKARRKLKNAEMTSDLATDQSEVEHRVRRVHHHRRAVSFSSEDEGPSLPVFPNPNNSCLSNQSASQPSYPSTSQHVNLATMTMPETPNAQASRSYQEKVLTLLEEIKKEQRDQRAILNGLRPNSSMPTLPDGCPELPINTSEDLFQLNIFLENKENFKQICDFFGTYGGFNVKDTIRRILQAVVSHTLSLQYNWKGTGGVKLGFCELTNVVKLISASVRRHSSFENATTHEVETCIKKWLMHAKDREGGRAERAKKKL